jgi:adenosyl cobinamide kinase/adenosyl cobinamide phosphate guanylyltransferase
MIFVTGGVGSGKRDLALHQLGFSEDDISGDPYDDRPVFQNLQVLIRESGALDNNLKAALLKKEVVICDEVGCGVIPIDGHERKWREEVGRSATAIAAEANTVVRMVCGMPQVIKGSLSRTEGEI